MDPLQPLQQPRPFKEPNWKAIEASEIWRDELLPWINEMRQGALESLAAVNLGDETLTLERYQYWRGQIAAYTALRDLPTELVEIDRRMKEEEKKDEIIRARAESRRHR